MVFESSGWTSMVEPLEELYFKWLCLKVMYVPHPTPSTTYWTLLQTLHSTEFVWLLSGDDNRAEDGLELRRDFLLEADIPDNIEWRTHPGCSLLEMFIAFSKRAAFMTSEPASDWFWEFMDNLGFKECTDGSGITPDEIGEILYQVVWRTYDLNGRGGIFPIQDPKHDQRDVEIWYQFCEYLMDQDRLP